MPSDKWSDATSVWRLDEPAFGCFFNPGSSRYWLGFDLGDNAYWIKFLRVWGLSYLQEYTLGASSNIEVRTCAVIDVTNLFVQRLCILFCILQIYAGLTEPDHVSHQQ